MAVSKKAARPMVIRGGRVLDPATGQAPERDILIARGKIEALGEAGLPVPDDAQTLDASDGCCYPASSTAHTHAHGGLARGLVGDRVPLELFLNSSAAALQSRSVEDKYLSAALSAAEMIRRGVTACYDLCVELPGPSVEGTFAVARAYDDAGIRAVVAPMLADITLYKALPGLIESFPPDLRQLYEAQNTTSAHDNLAVCSAIVRDWPFDRTRIRPAIAPTIPLHCSDAFLRACGDFAREHDVPLQTHLAETKVQAVLGAQKYGRSLTAHLDALGLITSRLSAAHAIWIDDDDIARLADGGARVAHNPMSNLRLGSGVAPVRRMIDRGLPVGVGTDGSNTSDGQNMFEAMRLAATLSRLEGPDPATWVSSAEALQMATSGSADLLGFARTGRIAPGFDADIVFLGLDAPHLVPFRAPLLQTVFGENGASIRRVMVGGRTIFQDGRLLTFDEASLRRRAEEAASRLDRANTHAADASAAVASLVGTFCVGLGCAKTLGAAQLCLPAGATLEALGRIPEKLSDLSDENTLQLFERRAISYRLGDSTQAESALAGR